MTEPRRLLHQAELSPLLREALQLGLDQPELPDAVKQRVGVRLAVALGAGAAGLAGSEIAAAASNALAGHAAAQGVGAVGAGVSTGAGALGTGVATATTSGMAAAAAGAGTIGLTAASGTAGAGALLGGSTLAGMVLNGVLGVAIGVGAIAGVSQITSASDDTERPASVATASVESAVRVESAEAVERAEAVETRVAVPPSADGVEATPVQTSPVQTTERAQRPAGAPHAAPRSARSAASVTVTALRGAAGDERRAALAEEVRALRRIGALLDTEPAAALRSLDEHAARFGASQLGAEAALLRIRALLGNGQRAQAVLLAEDLLRSPGARIYHERVRALLRREGAAN